MKGRKTMLRGLIVPCLGFLFASTGSALITGEHGNRQKQKRHSILPFMSLSSSAKVITMS